MNCIKKLTIVVSSLLVLVLTSNAQESPEKKFLFRSDNVELQTFFAEITPQTHFTRLNKQKVNVGVLNLGFILNEKFSVSFFMSTSPKVNLIPVPEFGSEEYFKWVEAGVELDKVSSSTEFLFVDFRHSGLRFNYIHNSHKIVFYRAGIAFGFLGGLTFTENQSFLGLFNNQIYKESVISLEPEIGVGVNLLSWWRFHIDAGYRFLGADTRIMGAADADSYTFSLTFAFGNFK